MVMLGKRHFFVSIRAAVTILLVVGMYFPAPADGQSCSRTSGTLSGGDFGSGCSTVSLSSVQITGVVTIHISQMDETNAPQVSLSNLMLDIYGVLVIAGHSAGLAPACITYSSSKAMLVTAEGIRGNGGILLTGLFPAGSVVSFRFLSLFASVNPFPLDYGLSLGTAAKNMIIANTTLCSAAIIVEDSSLATSIGSSGFARSLVIDGSTMLRMFSQSTLRWSNLTLTADIAVEGSQVGDDFSPRPTMVTEGSTWEIMNCLFTGGTVFSVAPLMVQSNSQFIVIGGEWRATGSTYSAMIALTNLALLHGSIFAFERIKLTYNAVSSGSIVVVNSVDCRSAGTSLSFRHVDFSATNAGIFKWLTPALLTDGASWNLVNCTSARGLQMNAVWLTQGLVLQRGGRWYVKDCYFHSSSHRAFWVANAQPLTIDSGSSVVWIGTTLSSQSSGSGAEFPVLSLNNRSHFYIGGCTFAASSAPPVRLDDVTVTQQSVWWVHNCTFVSVASPCVVLQNVMLTEFAVIVMTELRFTPAASHHGIHVTSSLTIATMGWLYMARSTTMRYDPYAILRMDSFALQLEGGGGRVSLLNLSTAGGTTRLVSVTLGVFGNLENMTLRCNSVQGTVLTTHGSYNSAGMGPAVANTKVIAPCDSTCPESLLPAYCHAAGTKRLVSTTLPMGCSCRCRLGTSTALCFDFITIPEAPQDEALMNPTETFSDTRSLSAMPSSDTSTSSSDTVSTSHSSAQSVTESASNEQSQSDTRTDQHSSSRTLTASLTVGTPTSSDTPTVSAASVSGEQSLSGSPSTTTSSTSTASVLPSLSSTLGATPTPKNDSSRATNTSSLSQSVSSHVNTISASASSASPSISSGRWSATVSDTSTKSSRTWTTSDNATISPTLASTSTHATAFSLTPSESSSNQTSTTSSRTCSTTENTTISPSTTSTPTNTTALSLTRSSSMTNHSHADVPAMPAPTPPAVVPAPSVVTMSTAQTSTSTTAAVAAIISVSPITASNVARIQTLQRLMLCRASLDNDDDGPVGFIPMRFGPAALDTTRGAVVSNILFVGGCTVIVFVVAGLLRSTRTQRRTLNEALGVVHMPSIVTVPFAAVLQPTTSAGVLLLASGNSAWGGDIVVGIFGLLLCLGAVTWLWWRRAQHHPCVLQTRNHKWQAGGAQEHMIVAVGRKLLVPRQKWVPVHPRDVLWKQKFLFLFADNSVTWYLAVEFSVSCALGLVAGIPVTGTAVCAVQVATAVLSYLTLFLIAVVVRPFLTLFMGVYTTMLNALGLLASVILMITLFASSVADAGQDAVGGIAILMSTLSTLKSLVDVGVTLHAVRRMLKRMSAMSSTTNDVPLKLSALLSEESSSVAPPDDDELQEVATFEYPMTLEDIIPLSDPTNELQDMINDCVETKEAFVAELLDTNSTPESHTELVAAYRSIKRDDDSLDSGDVS